MLDIFSRRISSTTSPRSGMIEDPPARSESPARHHSGDGVAMQILAREALSGSGGSGGALTSIVADSGAVPSGDDERQPLLTSADLPAGGGGVTSPAGGSAGDSSTPGSAKQQSAQPTKRTGFLFSGKSMERGEREKRPRKSSGSASEPSGMSEAIAWLWGGSKYSGIACMAASSLSYSLMGLLVKLLAVHSIPSFQTVMVRCVVISAVAGVGLRRMNHPLFGAPGVRYFLLARAVIGFFALSAFFYSIQALPLRDATMLNFTSPVFTALIARVALHEKWGIREMAGTVTSLIGVLLVTQPVLLFGGAASAEVADSPGTAVTPVTGDDPLAVVIALLAAALGGAAYVLVRSVGKTGEPPLVMVFVFAAFSCPAAAICMILLQKFVMPSALELAGMLLVGLTAFMAQLLLTRGLQLEKAGRATSIQYIKVLATYMLGVFFLGEMPTLIGLAGAVLIGISAAFIAMGQGSNSQSSS